MGLTTVVSPETAPHLLLRRQGERDVACTAVECYCPPHLSISLPYCLGWWGCSRLQILRWVSCVPMKLGAIQKYRRTRTGTAGALW
ncbi:hypothetical protein GBA52_017663 [Prunus armeniaca]|nr:hypothetical protein GBA52_017663 [Prunus armeniaca]